MVPLDRALVSSDRLSIVTMSLSAALGCNLQRSVRLHPSSLKQFLTYLLISEVNKRSIVATGIWRQAEYGRLPLATATKFPVSLYPISRTKNKQQRIHCCGAKAYSVSDLDGGMSASCTAGLNVC